MSEQLTRRQRLDAYAAEHRPDDYDLVEPGEGEEPERYLAIGECANSSYTYFALCEDEDEVSEALAVWLGFEDTVSPVLLVDLDTGASTSAFYTRVVPEW